MLVSEVGLVDETDLLIFKQDMLALFLKILWYINYRTFYGYTF